MPRTNVPAPDRPAFAHRHNDNGTTDSICKRCCKTVASARFEHELEMREEKHLCRGFNLEDHMLNPSDNSVQRD